MTRSRPERVVETPRAGPTGPPAARTPAPGRSPGARVADSISSRSCSARSWLVHPGGWGCVPRPRRRGTGVASRDPSRLAAPNRCWIRSNCSGVLSFVEQAPAEEGAPDGARFFNHIHRDVELGGNLPHFVIFDEAKPDDLAYQLASGPRKLFESLVQRHHLQIPPFEAVQHRIQRHAASTSDPLLRVSRTGMVDQDLLHNVGRGLC